MTMSGGGYFRAAQRKAELQLREGGPRLRGFGTEASIADNGNSAARSSAARPSRGAWKAWLTAGVATCANAGHNAQVVSAPLPDSTLSCTSPAWNTWLSS